MDEIYKKIWELAKPYYLEARPYDIFHIEWILKRADEIADKVGADKKLLIPLVILHDIGYHVFDDLQKVTRESSKKIHMEEGAKLADKILKQVGYDPELTKKIVYFVSVHDNWFYNDDEVFKQSKELALFNDLDFLSGMPDKARHKHIMALKNLDPKDFYTHWSKNKKLLKRPFCCKETQELYDKLVVELKNRY